MESVTIKKRERDSNFSPEEGEILISIISKFKHIIESKQTDSRTWREKADAWRKIAVLFAGVAGKSRSVKTLKGRFETLKRKMRFKLAGGNKNGHTRGGPQNGDNFSPSDQKLLSIMGDVSLVGIKNEFDCDNLEPSTSKNWVHLGKQPSDRKLDLSQGGDTSPFNEQENLETAEPETVIIEEGTPLQLETETAQIHPPDTSQSPPDDAIKVIPAMRKKQRTLKKSALFIKKRDDLNQAKIQFWQQKINYMTERNEREQQMLQYEAERNEREKLKSITELKVLEAKLELLEARLKTAKDI